MIKKLPYFFFIVGFLLILFPIAREYYYDWQENQLLSQFEQSAPQANTKDSSDTLVKAEYEKLSGLLTKAATSQEPLPIPTAESKPMQGLDDQALGIIAIDKIDLKLPILEGATKANMRYAATHLTGTNSLGKIGNAAIAAHRARTKGRLFNRLNELELGDKITIIMKDKRLIYTVSKISVVEPTDLSVLSSNDKASILTLITCDPLVNPTHRLIVQAKLET
ncbi:sortase A [Paenibacillus baekrokdamisoli]|nr:class D sortase [Paenibacillus baekrokdamisoli]MBB3067768.1 sortase A [Paenibacillus baekrokdamisoli]